MRIALFTEVFLPKIDGVVTRVTRTLDQLAEMGHEVLIFAPGSPPATYAGFDVVEIPSVPFWPIYPENRVGFITPGMFRRLRAFNPDVVHAVTPMWAAGFSSLIARRMGLPVLASFHTDVPEYTVRLGARWLEGPAKFGIRWFHGAAQVNLVTSAPMLEKAREYGIPNVEIWPKTVDTVGFSPAKRSREARALLSDGNPDAPLVIYVGRISAEKSAGRTLGIMEAVRQRVPGARLALVGDGPQREELRAAMDRDWITFTGYLSGSELQAAYASGDALLFPSTTETLGFAALEAFASGVPVVAARAGGLPYVVEEGRTGYLIDPSLPDSAWAPPLEQLLADPQHREAMSRAARDEALRWSWRSATQRLVEFYGKACEAAG